MVAVVILAVTFTVLLGLRNRDIELIGHARATTTATLLAHVKLMESAMQELPMVGEQGGTFSAAPPDIAALHGGTEDLSGFHWTRRILPTTFDSMREVRVRVSWFRGVDEEFVEMSSYVFLAPKPAS